MKIVNLRNGASDPVDNCELCGSRHIQWFTPARWNAPHGIFLCLACARINVRFSLLQASVLKAS